MSILGLVLLLFGAIGFVSSRCSPETAKCDRHFVKMEPHRNLLETPRQLKAWCRKQTTFYRCVEEILLEGTGGNMSALPINFLMSKMFTDDLCLEGSTGRNRYLKTAPCINSLDTEYCSLPEYLDIVTPDHAVPLSKCALSEKTLNCIAASMVSSCGLEAGKMYSYLLKMNTYHDEACYDGSSINLVPCREPESNGTDREEKLTEIYYGLVNRIGSIPEQVSELNQPPTYVATGSVEDVSTDEISESIEEDAESEEYSTISDVQSPGSSELPVAEHSKDSARRELFKMRPIITEPFKGLLFYNYSGKEFVFYWRQPDNYPIENATCEHLQPSYKRGIVFRCLLHRRDREPFCVSSKPGSKGEAITPEIVREIDPEVPKDSVTEFGPSPYWMEEIDDMRRQKEQRELLSTSTVSSYPTSSGSSSLVTELPTLLATSSSLLRVPGYLNEDPDFKWWEYPTAFSDELRNDIISVLIPEPEYVTPPALNVFHFDGFGYIFLYEPFTNSIENLTCSRINECHPKGRGVFKCAMMARRIADCDECYGVKSSTSGYNSEGSLAETSRYKQSSETTYPSVPEDSVSTMSEEYLSSTDDFRYTEELSSTEDLITVLFGGDERPEPIEQDTFIYDKDVAVNRNELAEVDLATTQEPEVDSDAVRFVLVGKERLDESDESTPDIVYAVDRRDFLGNDEKPVIPPEFDGYNFLNENIIVLQTIPSTDGEGITYALLDASEEDQSEDTV